MQGLIGKKLGMTRVFDERGEQVPVTVLECGPCVVLQRKSAAGKKAADVVQVAYGDVTERRLPRAQAAVFRKHELSPKRFCREFSLDAGEELAVGDTVKVDMFEKVTHVDVTGVTKGRGFQGVMHRHGMHGGPMTHGGHSKRRIGSIGCRELPGRIYKGKLMPGHMGNLRVTKQNLRVVQVRPEENLLLVHGAVPGHAGTLLIIKRALKKGGK